MNNFLLHLLRALLCCSCGGLLLVFSACSPYAKSVRDNPHNGTVLSGILRLPPMSVYTDSLLPMLTFIKRGTTYTAKFGKATAEDSCKACCDKKKSGYKNLQSMKSWIQGGQYFLPLFGSEEHNYDDDERDVHDVRENSDTSQDNGAFLSVGRRPVPPPDTVRYIMCQPLIDRVHLPILVAKTSNKYKQLHGRIVQFDSSGVRFHTSMNTELDEKPLFFPLEDIGCLIDSTNTILYGDVRAFSFHAVSMEIGIVPVSKPDAEPILLVAREGERFFYQLPAGKYRVKELWLQYGFFKRMAATPPSWVFEVKKDRLNYLDEWIMGSIEDGVEIVYFNIVDYAKIRQQLPVGVRYNRAPYYAWFVRKKGSVPSDAVYAPIELVK